MAVLAFTDLQTIRSGTRFAVGRAHRRDGSSVIVKRVCTDGAELGAVERLEHEHKMLGALHLPGIPRPLAFVSLEGKPALVVEDLGRRSLADLLADGPLAIDRFLELATAMARLVGQLHERGVIHRDLCPDNFIVTDAPSRIGLVDFESATVVPAFAQAPGDPDELEGTLAYMPPEQAGRMKRVVDRRADLYALGATFYEMLTGHPPFPSPDPLEVVHAHAALAPHAPAIVTPTVPTAISDIVLKLLAKMPAWRYQTAGALAADLAEAERQWKARGDIARFELARQDLPHGLFLLEEKLYGRERELQALAEVIARVVGGGAEVFLVTGQAGVGKSSLVAAVRDASEGRCCFIAGKGDQLQGNVPYAPIVEAFRGVLEPLSRQTDQAAAARAAINRAIAPNGRVLTDALPDLRTLLGDQAPVAQVGAVEAENRFQLAFTAFVRALVELRGPLVLFIDDLQWVDPASLRLVRALATDPDARSLLVLGAHRSDDVGPTHPVAQTIALIRSGGGRVGGLELAPLDGDSLTALLCDALRAAPSRVAPLAAVVRRKTAGNPFFVRQFLGYLYRRQLLTDAGEGQWSWDLAGIDAAEVTPNVVDLLSTVIRSLPERAQAALSAAACIGNRFELAVLAGVQDAPLDDVAQTLGPPIEQGLLVPAIEGPRFGWVRSPVEIGPALAPTYRFVHDRIQQAAYERLSAAERESLHLRIGRWLQGNVPDAERDAAIDAVVDQLDRAVGRLTPPERLELARLNERAAKQARAASAYASALRYAQAALALLPDGAWDDAELHASWLALHHNAAECAGLTGDQALSDRLLDEGIERCRLPLEKAELHAIGMRMNAMRGAHARSIARALDGLRLLGIELPRAPSPAMVVAEKERVLELLRQRSRRELLDAPPMADAVDRAALRILSSFSSAWFAAPELFMLATFRAAELTATRGIVHDVCGSSAAYGSLGVALAIDGDYANAYRYCQLGAELAERSGNPAQQARTLLFLGGHVGGWRTPLADGVPILRHAYACSLESGDLEFAAYALSNLVSVRMLGGAPLDQVLVDAGAALAFDRVHHPSGVAAVLPFVQAAKCLKGLTRGATYDDDTFDEAAFLASKGSIGPSLLRVLKVQTSFLLGERERAIELAAEAPAWLPALRNLPQQVEVHFYAALALAGAESGRAALLPHLRRLDVWAENAPSNFGHKRDLVRAELARLDGQPVEALAFYHKAIEQANVVGFVQDEALAHELCARFHAARGAARMAHVHLCAATEGYAHWGATAKVVQLHAEFPTLDLRTRRHRITTPAPTPGLDYLSLLKVTEALTDELDHDRLVEKLARICTEAAHAERGALILDEAAPVVRARTTASGDVTLERTPLDAARALPISIIEHVFRTQELLLLGDAARKGRFAADPDVAGRNVRSVLAVPLCRHGRALAVLYFENNLASDAFEPERGRMFELLSVELAITLENSRLFAARKRSEAALRLVADASARLAETLDYERVLATIGAIAVPALADWCLVEAAENGTFRPVAAAHVDAGRVAALEEMARRFPADVDSPLRGRVLRSGRSLIVAEVTDEERRSWARDREGLRLIEAMQARSLMVVPLVARGRTLGVATFGLSHATRRYDAADLALAEELVRRIALAVDNAALHRDLQQALHQRQERDRYLRLIFRALPGAVWAFDRDLRVTHASGRFPGPQEIATAVPGSTLYDFIGTRDPTNALIAHHLEALAGKRQSFEHLFNERWYTVHLEPLRDREQRVLGCVGVALDITDKRAAAERLAQSEARLSAAQAIAHIGSFEWSEDPSTLTWTDELLRIYGLAPEEFGGTLDAFLAMVHPDEVEATRRTILDAYHSGRPFTYDHRIVRKDGQVRVIHTRGDVIKDEHGAPARMIGTSWDVTEIAEANRERERTLSLLGATIEATADGILAVDRDGRISVCNRRFVEMWRVPPSVVARREEAPVVESMRHQLEEAEGLARGITERGAPGDADGLDIVRLRDGRVLERYWRPQRIGDAVVGTVWSFRDVSERERLLRRALFLADASRLLVSLDVDQALDAAAHLAVPYLGDGCAIDLFGEGGPRRLVAISREADRPIAPEPHPSVLAGRSTIYQADGVSYLGVPLLMKDRLGGAITVRAQGHRRYGRSDLDLVEELGRRAALAVENAHLYRESQEALRVRDEFLAIAAHEIRGPASAIHLAVQSLQQGLLPDDARPKLLAIIEREDRRLARFVNELLELGRARGGLRLHYQPVDLGALVGEVTARMGPDFSRSGSSLTVDVQGPVVGRWDKFQLDQMVTNLIGNAIKFGLGNPIAVTVRTDGDRAVFAVEDHGIGIEREAQRRIFQPFERGVSVRHYGGLGLGLHIVKTIVDAMGGTIRVESEPGRGSTFTVLLPLKGS